MAKEKRGFFESMFGKKREPTYNNTTVYTTLNGQDISFTSFGDNAYNSDVVRSCINAIATNTAKLKPKHIRTTEVGIKETKSNIERLLSIQPNPYMNAFSFYYKVITHLYLKNNAFIYVQKDEFTGEVLGFYPIPFDQVELREYQGELYIRFRFRSGKHITLPYEEIIHLRRFFNEHDIYGDNNSALFPTLEVINTTNQGIINAILKSAKLRGLLKFVQNMMKPEDLKKQRDNFVKDYMSIDNDGGIAALDAKAEYQELNSKPILIDDKQMGLIDNKVYAYFNINEKIVKSNYTEDEWNAFYESVIEPLAVQLSLEFTSKLFTKKEIGFGNQIVFEANRLQYASNSTKISLVRDLAPLGLFTINEAREIFNLAPVEGGDKRLQTLNVVNADKADKYQEVDDGGENDAGKNNTE